MIEILRELLAIREFLVSIADKLASQSIEEECPEIAEMQALERKLFEKVNGWDKP